MLSLCRSKYCCHGYFWFCFVYMNTMWSHIILIGVKNATYHFTQSAVLRVVTFVFKFLGQLSRQTNREKWTLLADMQHSHPHITLLCAEIFLIWGRNMLRIAQSLMTMLFCLYLDYFMHPSSGVLTVLLCSYFTDIFNTSLGISYFWVWPSIDTLGQHLAI